MIGTPILICLCQGPDWEGGAKGLDGPLAASSLPAAAVHPQDSHLINLLALKLLSEPASRELKLEQAGSWELLLSFPGTREAGSGAAKLERSLPG